MGSAPESPTGTESERRDAAAVLSRTEASRRRLRRVFLESFTVADVAEPLASFDAERPASEMRAFLDARGYDLVGVRREGLVCGYAVREELAGGTCRDHLRAFVPDDLVAEGASLQEVIRSLAANGRCFVVDLHTVSGIVTLDDLEKPPVRMFLFGMITLFEMLATRRISELFPGDSWQTAVAPGRLEKAVALQAERARRGHAAALLDCLQLSDKGQLLLRVPAVAQRLGVLGMTSRKSARRALRELEALRNNLAHTQEIIPTGWERIALFSERLDALLSEL